MKIFIWIVSGVAVVACLILAALLFMANAANVDLTNKLKTAPMRSARWKNSGGDSVLSDLEVTKNETDEKENPANL